MSNNSAPDKGNPCKHWVFTLNNYTPEELILLRDTSLDDNFSFIGWAQEVAPTTGTPHLQGSFSLVKKRTSRSLHRLPGFERIALMVMKGTPAQAYKYYACNPDKGEPSGLETYGEVPKVSQGKRTDLDEVVDALESGMTLKQVARKFPRQWIRYHNGIRNLAAVLTVRDIDICYGPYPWDIKISNKTLLLWGRAGVGKTEFAKYLLPNAFFCTHLDKLELYDEREYSGIIFDEACFIHLPRETQIFICDYDNPRDIHIRYTTAYIPKNTKKIMLTNRLPSEILLVNDEAIARRIEIHEIVPHNEERVNLDRLYEEFQ